jgi:uncharacterized DUF497 family protein
VIAFDFVEWDDEDDPKGNVWHIAEHGISPEEVEDVLYGPGRDDISRSSGRPLKFGRTSGGKDIVIVYEAVTDSGVTVIRPVTAYEYQED